MSDSKSFQAGVRQFTYSEEGGALRIWINGRRFIPRGRQLGLPRIDAAISGAASTMPPYAITAT